MTITEQPLIERASDSDSPPDAELAIDRIVEHIRRLSPALPAGADLEGLVLAQAAHFAAAPVRMYLEILISRAVLDDLRARARRHG